MLTLWLCYMSRLYQKPVVPTTGSSYSKEEFKFCDAVFGSSCNVRNFLHTKMFLAELLEALSLLFCNNVYIRSQVSVKGGANLL